MHSKLERILSKLVALSQDHFDAAVSRASLLFTEGTPPLSLILTNCGWSQWPQPWSCCQWQMRGKLLVRMLQTGKLQGKSGGSLRLSDDGISWGKRIRRGLCMGLGRWRSDPVYTPRIHFTDYSFDYYYTWVIVNNDFLALMVLSTNDFHLWLHHSWKSLTDTSDQKCNFLQ